MKICFICLYAYALFKPSAGTRFGGSEVRAWLLATGLARNPSHQVSFVVFDHGQPREERIGAVSVYPHSYYRTGARRAKQWPGVSKYIVRSPRFPYLSIRRIEPAILIELPVALARWVARNIGSALGRRPAPPLRPGHYEAGRDETRVYERIDADAYCVFGVGDLAAQVAAYCSAFGKKLILLANSDENFLPEYAPSHTDLYREVIAAADVVVTQNGLQRELLRNRFGRDSITIRNPVELAAPLRADASRHGHGAALWIGRSEEVKQPHILVALARALPHIRFLMVMNRLDPILFDRIASEKPGNVELLEWAGYREVDGLFAGAFALINTSILEGFPNTFLQAGKHGVPILSLNVDPDGFIAGHRCGFVASGDVGVLAQKVRMLRDEPDTWRTCSENVRRYTETYHGLDGRIGEFDALLARAVGTAA
jgi:glycosyltransferase involved in cell wall biosynthesis